MVGGSSPGSSSSSGKLSFPGAVAHPLASPPGVDIDRVAAMLTSDKGTGTVGHLLHPLMDGLMGLFSFMPYYFLSDKEYFSRKWYNNNKQR
jgi:hypothetical protein